MNYIFKKEIINYDYIDNKANTTVLFLHGWGGNKNSFSSTVNLLKHKFNILSLTLPTIQPTFEEWTLFDYFTLVKILLKLHNIEKIYVVCHSFGFRVACLLNQYIENKKIVVTGGAGIRKNSIIKRIEQTNNKILLKQKKFKFLFDALASVDYISLSSINQKTFKNIVNQNLIKYSKFSCPVLLFWGKYDHETPPFIAKHLLKSNQAKLIVTKSDHFAYLKENKLFNFEVIKFFK